MSDARDTANCSFPGITNYISEKDLIQMLLIVNIGNVSSPHRAYIATSMGKKIQRTKLTTKRDYIAPNAMQHEDQVPNKTAMVLYDYIKIPLKFLIKFASSSRSNMVFLFMPDPMAECRISLIYKI